MRYAMFILLLACGSATPSPVDPVMLEEPPPAPRPSRPTPPPRPSLTRSGLNATLDAGPGAFLASVRVRAARPAGRFAGWEIESLWAGADVGLEPGDIVVSVNGRSMERPESLPSLFQELRSAKEIVVEFRRGPERRVARFPVVEDAGKINP